MISICFVNAKRTYVTAISAIVRMYQSVLIINGSGEEALIANGTFERSFSCVYFPDVVFQVRTDRVTCLATFVRTSEGLYA